MSFGIYAVGYLILDCGCRVSGPLDAYSAAVHCGDCGDHAWDWRGYGCADYST